MRDHPAARDLDADWTGRRVAVHAAGTFVTLTGMVVAITLLQGGMHAVLAIGGACASGGPSVIATPCPHGVPTVILVAIFGGLAMLWPAWAASFPVEPSGPILAWMGLFLAMGWSFLDAGLHPPAPHHGVVVSWLLLAAMCGLFVPGPLLVGPLFGAASDGQLARSERLKRLRDDGAIDSEQFKTALMRVMKDRRYDPFPELAPRAEGRPAEGGLPAAVRRQLRVVSLTAQAVAIAVGVPVGLLLFRTLTR